MKRALIALLLCTPAYAGPLAVCNAGKCVMEEADYRRLQEFHKQTRKGVETMQAEQDRNMQSFLRLLNELSKCRAMQPEKEV